jgi:hypothetical protein
MSNRYSNSDFVNGCLFTLGAMIWAAIALQFVPDSPVGVAIILEPGALLLLPGVFFIARFRLRNLQ